ncbi:hypothetical protein ECN1_0940 [Escherichia coli N1]|nr:hypothetical protein ECN1_0940 [Escherichia coli N1]
MILIMSLLFNNIQVWLYCVSHGYLWRVQSVNFRPGGLVRMISPVVKPDLCLF